MAKALRSRRRSRKMSRRSSKRKVNKRSQRRVKRNQKITQRRVKKKSQKITQRRVKRTRRINNKKSQIRVNRNNGQSGGEPFCGRTDWELEILLTRYEKMNRDDQIALLEERIVKHESFIRIRNKSKMSKMSDAQLGREDQESSSYDQPGVEEEPGPELERGVVPSDNLEEDAPAQKKHTFAGRHGERTKWFANAHYQMDLYEKIKEDLPELVYIKSTNVKKNVEDLKRIQEKVEECYFEFSGEVFDETARKSITNKTKLDEWFETKKEEEREAKAKERRSILKNRARETGNNRVQTMDHLTEIFDEMAQKTKEMKTMELFRPHFSAMGTFGTTTQKCQSLGFKKYLQDQIDKGLMDESRAEKIRLSGELYHSWLVDPSPSEDTQEKMRKANEHFSQHPTKPDSIDEPTLKEMEEKLKEYRKRAAQRHRLRQTQLRLAQA